MYIGPIILFLVLLYGNEISSQQCAPNANCNPNNPCTSDHVIGANDPSAYNTKKDNNELGVAIMMHNSGYQFDCCGFISQWEFYSYMSGSFNAQVWRLDAGNTYRLVGYNTLAATNNGSNEQITIPNGQRIRCDKDDFIGMHSTGNFPITYEMANNNHERYKATGITTAMTSQFTWSTPGEDKDYAINALVTLSKIPTLYPISDVTHYNDEIYIGMLQTTVSATDDDIEDQNYLYVTIDSISNNGINYFAINSSTNNINITSLPPVNTYTVTLKVEDSCAESSTMSFKINILNRLPVMHNLPATISISEDTLENILIFTVNATDTVTDPLTCTMAAGNTNLFTVNTISPTTQYGVYTKIGAIFDYATINSYTVTVQCADSNDTVNGVLTINLIKNEPPVIHSLPYTESISEDLSIRTLVHTINVTDSTGDVITCLLGVNSTLFEVDKITTESADYGIFLKGGTLLNYDVTPSYVLSVTCKDKRRGDTDQLTVNLIRNEPPTIVNLPMSCNIHENTQTETIIYTVSVTDPTNDTVTCSFLTPTSIFYIQVSANQFQFNIFVRSNPGFNYDATRSYTLDLSCIDLRRSDSNYFYIYLIRNKPPQFTNLQGKTTVSAPNSESGQLVFTVMASDADNDQLQYSMTAPANTPFSINPSNGAISLIRSILTESITGYDLYIYVSDGRDDVGPNTLTILITDINSPPVFKNLPQTVTVLEGVTIGTVVFQSQVDDKNHGDQHLFTINYDPPDGRVYFTVNKTDGQVMTLEDVDYEIIPFKTFILNLTVTDTFMYDTGMMTINILNVNEAPVFTKKSYTISAPEGKGGTVLPNPYYQCTDPDGDNLIFSFNCGSNTGRLDMNQTNGLFSYAITYDLDVFGTPSDIKCQIFITDGEYSDMANLNISITDANDNSPVFQPNEYTFFVSVNTAVGSVVGYVHAKDADIGNYGYFIYHIDQQTIAYSLFNVDNDGEITTKQPFSGYPEGSILSFKIYAVDVGGFETSSNVTVVIPVTSVSSVDIDGTIKYKTFFTYAANMAWFVPLMFVLFVTACVVVYTIYEEVAERIKAKREAKRRPVARRSQRQ